VYLSYLFSYCAWCFAVSQSYLGTAVALYVVQLYQAAELGRQRLQ
jgi:hypothetical protein